jgi:hypothetical protein
MTTRKEPQPAYVNGYGDKLAMTIEAMTHIGRRHWDMVIWGSTH